MDKKFSLYTGHGLTGVMEHIETDKIVGTKSYLNIEDIVDLLNKQADRISDLKTKLNEKDEELNNLSQMCLICNKDQENEKLRRQLVEKEELLVLELKSFADYAELCEQERRSPSTNAIKRTVAEHLHEYTNGDFERLNLWHIRDKHLFAINWLNKAVEIAQDTFDKALKNSSLNTQYYDELLDKFDSLITELKETYKNDY